MEDHSDSENFDGDISVCTPSRRPCHRPRIKRAKQKSTVVVNDENAAANRNNTQVDFFKRPKGLRPTDSNLNIARNQENGPLASDFPAKPALKAKKGQGLVSKSAVRFQILDDPAPSTNNIYDGHLYTPKRGFSPSDAARKEMAGRTPFATELLNTSDDMLDTVFGTPRLSPTSSGNVSMSDLLGHNYDIVTTAASMQKATAVPDTSGICDLDLLGSGNESDDYVPCCDDVDTTFDILRLMDPVVTPDKDEPPLADLKATPAVSNSQRKLSSSGINNGLSPTIVEYKPHGMKDTVLSQTDFDIPETPALNVIATAAAEQETTAPFTEKTEIVVKSIVEEVSESKSRHAYVQQQDRVLAVDGVSLNRPGMRQRNVGLRRMESAKPVDLARLQPAKAAETQQQQIEHVIAATSNILDDTPNKRFLWFQGDAHVPRAVWKHDDECLLQAKWRHQSSRATVDMNMNSSGSQKLSNVNLSQNQFSILLDDDSLLCEEEVLQEEEEEESEDADDESVSLGLSQLLPPEYFATQLHVSSRKLSESIFSATRPSTPFLRANGLQHASKLGSASRVLVDDDNESETDSILPTGKSTDTNIAVAVASQQDLTLEDEMDEDANNASVFSAATTITVDMSHFNRRGEDAQGIAASLTVARKHRRKDFEDSDIKEILLVSKPGCTTTTLIQFTNRGKSALALGTNAIGVRFDVHSGVEDETNKDSSLVASAFTVSPSFTVVEVGCDAVFSVTFAPSASVGGNYTGVLKIRSNNKSHTLLLRGEARKPALADATKCDIHIVDSSASILLTSMLESPQNYDRSLNKSRQSRHCNTSSLSRFSDSEVACVRNGSDDKDQASTHYSSVLTSSKLLKTPDDKISEATSDAAVIDPATPQEELARRQRFIKDWIGRIRERVDAAESRMQQSSSRAANREELSVSNEVVLSSQLLQGDIFISGALGLCNNNATPVEVEVQFTTNMLKLLNHDITETIVIPPSCNCELTVVLAIASYANLVAGASQNYSIVGNRVKVGAAVVSYTTVNGGNQGRTTRQVQIWAKVSDLDLSTVDCSSHEQLNNSIRSCPASTSSPLVTGIRNYGDLLPRQRLPLHCDVNTAGSLYFKQQVADFGCCPAGSLGRLKVDLYNTTNHEMRVSLKDPSLPFVLLHNEITLRPRCFVRVPVRFVPSCHSINTIKSYSGVLEGTVQVASQTLTCSVRLAGSSY